jgi:hypothetical protein
LVAFVVHGPCKVDFEKRKGGRTLVFDNFWLENPNLAKKQGCYVFAIRNRGLTPMYIGKATKSFKQETFNPPNRQKYHNGFSEYGRGTPVMYFMVHPTQRGRTNTKQIGELEDFPYTSRGPQKIQPYKMSEVRSGPNGALRVSSAMSGESLTLRRRTFAPCSTSAKSLQRRPAAPPPRIVRSTPNTLEADDCHRSFPAVAALSTVTDDPRQAATAASTVRARSRSRQASRACCCRGRSGGDDYAGRWGYNQLYHSSAYE